MSITINADKRLQYLIPHAERIAADLGLTGTLYIAYSETINCVHWDDLNTVFINKALCMEYGILVPGVLAHEMRHIAQIRQRRVMPLSQEGTLVFMWWDGQLIEQDFSRRTYQDYLDLPWEQDARAYEEQYNAKVA